MTACHPDNGVMYGVVDFTSVQDAVFIDHRVRQHVCPDRFDKTVMSGVQPPDFAVRKTTPATRI